MSTSKRSKVANHSKPAPKVPYPKAFIASMMRGWAPRAIQVESIANAGEFRRRRVRLGKLFPGELLVVPTGHERVRSNDTHYRFRPGSDFSYLVGSDEPDCVLVLEPVRGGGHRSILFVEPNPGRSSETFFTDRDKGELWVGPRLGVPESQRRFGVDAALPLSELPDYLKLWSRALGKAKVRILSGYSQRLEALGYAPKLGMALETAISELRLIKSPLEVQELVRAAKVTKRALADAIAVMRPGNTERHVEVAFGARARLEGNDVGYGTIAAAGANACILHWHRNDARIRQGDLFLIDAGVEVQSLYTADVTRTFPVSGRFSPTQRKVYDLVRAAQRAAIAAAKPGAHFLAVHRAAMKVLAEGLDAFGLEGYNSREALDPEKTLYRRYTLHGTSHMLGIDVHDSPAARNEKYRDGKLRAGMVITIEPGLYFQPDDLTVPKALRGIGIRIEDDVLITQTGRRLLTQAIPRDADDIEAWVQESQR